MGETIEFDCIECGAGGQIDSTSLNFITSATELTRGEALLCDDHLAEVVGGVTFDLGIGGGHTGDEAFQNTRHQRNAENNADEIAAAQAEHTISFGPTFEGDTGTRVEVAMPSVAKHHLKQTTRSVTGYEYDHSRQAWTVDATQASVTETVETLRDHGWAVDPPTE